jgi:hypothetical protein
LTAPATAPLIDALQLPYVVQTVSDITRTGVMAADVSSSSPHGLCDERQGILRAYGRLRI